MSISGNANIANNATSMSGTQLREKLSTQLEKIVRKTQSNLNKGVYKPPIQQPLLVQPQFSGNVNSALMTPNYRNNSFGVRAEFPSSSHRNQPNLFNSSAINNANADDTLR